MCRLAIAISVLAISTGSNAQESESFNVTGSDGAALTAETVATFDHPWAMAFLPNGDALVTEMTGAIWRLDENGEKLGKISGGPEVVMRNQGGLGDIIVHPGFAQNATVFISYVERDPEDDSLSGAAVERATLNLAAGGGALTNREVIWRQTPKVKGNGHYGHRLAIGDDGHLFITSGDRQKFTPAQNMDMNLGKVVRIQQDGTTPPDNPFYGGGLVADQVWTLGHRNPLGIAFDGAGRLWAHEMGPRGGDELNMIVRSENYGYPIVSNGDHYSGKQIPDHASNPIYENPMISWTPVISPAGLVIYDGAMFSDWSGDALIGGLSSKALIRVSLDGGGQTDNVGGAQNKKRDTPTASEAARYEWGERIREVEQGPDGAIYVLEDEEGARLLRLTPAGN